MKKWQKEIIQHCEKDNFETFSKCINICKSFNMPKKIYKYCSFDENKYNLKNLVYNKHYLNNPTNFNDPYDSCMCYYFSDVLYDITKEHIEYSMNMLPLQQKNILKLLDKGLDIFEIQKKYRYDFDVVEELDFIIEDIQDSVEEIYISKVRKIISDNIRISCFSESKDNILMWAHYAQNHTGFCLEYDLTNPDLSHFTSGLYPVFYTSKPFKRFEKEEDINSFSFHFLTLLTKFKDWAYEKEWRYISFDPKKEFVDMQVNPTNVYLGTKINDENYKLISELCEIHKITCHKMFMRADKFYVQPSICFC